MFHFDQALKNLLFYLISKIIFEPIDFICTVFKVLQPDQMITYRRYDMVI